MTTETRTCEVCGFRPIPEGPCINCGHDPKEESEAKGKKGKA